MRKLPLLRAPDLRLEFDREELSHADMAIACLA